MYLPCDPSGSVNLSGSIENDLTAVAVESKLNLAQSGQSVSDRGMPLRRCEKHHEATLARSE